jgi:hypothetical protein
MKREEGLLNLLCLIAAAGLFAFIIYNLFAAGSIISTDGLFFTVVPLVLALSFLFVPAQELISRRLAKKTLARESERRQITSRSNAVPASISAPALKDARGRTMPPDVSRLVAQLKAHASKEE